ncbi:hypothetical protein PR202_ga03760 [Eleusine coracana subsp. coracana]|uniref:Factor of DNA methylation 1-5/IDN2 domain-containing protein n=1 Tax=Eleusine coracana subsp. coracana TaxID=191504 RepID=A0AAV5BPW9_ELECO|nr:hypothetical protein PR202_ga03760 [Eleusine coracana subsp. coracana]
MGKLDEEEDVVDDEKLIALKEEWGIEAYNTIVRCMVLQEDVVDDEKLIALKEEWWVETYNAVVRALLEMNKYNPSARHPVHQMWNFRDDREASVSEAIGLVMKDMKT